MSNNQKQAPTGAPQQQPRFAQGPYVPRAPPPQRSDGFHVTTPTTGYVPQQNQNQPPNQGGVIRGMAPTGPPQQASTPPTSEQLKQMQQQQPGQLQQLTFVQQPVRTGQNFTHFRTPPPNQGGPRMTTNHHRQVAASGQMYAQHAVPLYTPPIGQPMTYQLPMPSYSNAPRPTYYPTQQFTAMLPSQLYHGSYPAQPPQNPATAYYSPQYTQPMTLAGRPGPQGPAVPSVPQGNSQPQQPPMTPQSLGLPQQPKKKSRDKAIPIINPQTGKNINDEDESLPPSGDSSARETPQPNSSSMEVVADFAARVAIVASEGKLETPIDIPVEPIMFQSNIHPPVDGDHLQKMESVIQNSKLQVSTKEFVPEITKHVPKENCTSIMDTNTVEVHVVSSPIKAKPVKTQQPPPPPPVKELETVFVNKELMHEVQPEVVKVTKNVKVKVELIKPVEQLIVEQLAPVEECVDKSKRSGQKVKELASTPAAGPKHNAPVPGSQPPKPTSKANKQRELNMKGAIKEGTDMDAFNSPEVPVAVPDNCIREQLPPPQPQQPQQQMVQQPQPTQQAPQQQKVIPTESVAPVVVSEVASSNAITKPVEVKPLIKNKVDVTSIVKEVPKPLKPFVPPAPVPATQESQDETDRAVTEKIVQVKNEANIKSNPADTNDNQVNDKNVIRYKKDQWSPLNTDGKKCYDRDFLICLQNNPKSKKKPDNLPDLDVVLKGNNRSRVVDTRSFGMNRQSEVLMPSFHKSISQHGPMSKRGSQQGKAGSKSGKPNTIHVTLSLKEDVKLRETENAWRPARLGTGNVPIEDDLKTAELYKKVRGVLNKLTPEKFDKLLNQVQALTIDNAERLQGVIDLVFEKAVDEPNFSVAYALMCKQLALMQVPAERKNKNDEQEYVNFRKLLITRCQLEFEKNSVDENARNIKMKEIEECADPEKKKELQAVLDEEDRRMRVKSVGNIRFIGELFKQDMLTVNIMLRCVTILLESKDEDSLECLCKLLTTIGKDLEVSRKQSLSSYFGIMQEVVDKKHGRISSRVRFMLQDVIDLRNSKWVPRRQDLNPKTMEQIQKEADTEQLNIQVMNSGPMNTPRKDDRSMGGSVSGSDRKRRNNPIDEGGWSTAGPARGRIPYTVEPSKLMNKPPPMDEMTLGSKNQFGQWGRGSNIKTQPTHAPVTNANIYTALENINSEQDKIRYDSRLKDAYISKGPSMERTYKQSYEDGRGSRSGSQHRNSQQRPAPSPSPSIKREPPPQLLQPITSQLSTEHLKLRMQNILDEYLNDCCNLKETELDIKQSIDTSKLQEFVIHSYNDVLEKSSSLRHKTGKLFAGLVKSQVISIDEYSKALKEVLGQADDLIIDIPMLWNYLAEMIVPVITEEVMSLDRLCACMEVLMEQGHSHKLLAQLLKQLFADKGPGYVVDIWKSSGVSFTHFMTADLVNSYIKDNKFDFMIGGAGTPIMQGSLSWEQVHNKLLQFFSVNTSFDTITDWISANVRDRVAENQFIRTLVTAICEHAVHSVNNIMKLKTEVLQGHYLLLQRYVDNQERYELQCLFAVQSLVHKWEHPPGLMLAIFERLWDDGNLSTESFLAWEKCNDPAEQEGKGVALKSLQSLFTAVKEPDDDSQSSSSEDA